MSARASGPYGIVREYVGHGIGSEMHMDPPVPNYGRAGRGPVLAEGMALAIEPMLVLGDPQTCLLDDGWTVVTADGTWSAHFEHTVAITAAGPWVLTAEDGGSSGFERLHAEDQRPGGPAAAGVRRGAARRAEEDPMAADPRIRASDDDRERAVALLREHHAAGRLTVEEFNERLDKAYAAKTLGDLDELMADLPAIDLYRLPDASLPPTTAGQIPGHGFVSRRPAPGGLAHRHGRFSPAWPAAWGSWFSVTLVCFVVWAAERSRVPVAAVGRRAVGGRHARPLDHRQPSRRRPEPRPPGARDHGRPDRRRLPSDGSPTGAGNIAAPGDAFAAVTQERGGPGSL